MPRFSQIFAEKSNGTVLFGRILEYGNRWSQSLEAGSEYKTHSSTTPPLWKSCKATIKDFPLRRKYLWVRERLLWIPRPAFDISGPSNFSLARQNRSITWSGPSKRLYQSPLILSLSQMLSTKLHKTDQIPFNSPPESQSFFYTGINVKIYLEKQSLDDPNKFDSANPY